MNYYYLDSNNEPVGSFPEEQMREFLSEGSLTAETLVAAEGTDSWITLQHMVLGGHSVIHPPASAAPPAQAPVSVVIPRPSVNLNPPAQPYHRPPVMPRKVPSRGAASSSFNPNLMPGIGRLTYFLSLLGIAAGLLIMMLLFGGSQAFKVMSPDSDARHAVMALLGLGLLAMLLVAFIFKIILVIKRAQNIGWSGCLTLVAAFFIGPLVSMALLILPPGYVYTRKIDTAGKIILFAVLGPILFIVLFAFFLQLSRDKEAVPSRPPELQAPANPSLDSSREPR